MDFNLSTDKEENKCNGLYFRGSASSYLSKHNSIEVRKSLRLLKNKSCKGCEKCAWFFEHVSEDICYVCNPDYLGNIENGKMYTFKVTTSQGYEDLYPEIDSIDFVEVDE